MRRLKVDLTAEQRRELEWARDHHSRPYVRERAAAILKVADGQSVRQVALHGLLKRRRPETVREWIARYMAEGLKGLLVRPGRGRKPAFSPSSPDGCGSGRRVAGGGATLTPAVRVGSQPMVAGWAPAGRGLAARVEFGRGVQAIASAGDTLQAGSALCPLP